MIDKLSPDESQAIERLVRSIRQRTGSGTGSFKKLLDDALIFKDGPNEIRLSQLPKAAVRELGKLEKASDEMEAFLLKGLFGQMQKGLQSTGPYGDLANDMFVDSLSRTTSTGGGLGISQMVFEPLARRMLQEQLAHIKNSTSEERKTA